MTPFCRRVFAILLSLSLLDLLNVRADDPGPVAVPLRSGRIVTGEVDEATDERLLKLRIATPRILLVHSVRWESAVRIDGTNRGWSREELCEWARQKRSAPVDSAEDVARPIVPATAASPTSSVVSADVQFLPRMIPASALPRPFPRPLPDARLIDIPVQIESLAIEVRPANWDADADDDGLEVRLFPRAIDGTLVPASGSARVRLFSRRVMVEPSRQLSLDRATPVEAGHWSAPVRHCDYEDWGAVVRLPWQRVDPQLEPGYADIAECHVEFGANVGRTVRARTHVLLHRHGSAAVAR